MSEQLDKKSILEMSMGAILERVDYEMGKVMDNILDPNTKATAKRKISVTLELIPSADRRTITVQSTAKCSLTPTDPVTTSLYITNAPSTGDSTAARASMAPEARSIYTAVSRAANAGRMDTATCRPFFPPVTRAS